jgi:hypothetical protein
LEQNDQTTRAENAHVREIQDDITVRPIPDKVGNVLELPFKLRLPGKIHQDDAL